MLTANLEGGVGIAYEDQGQGQPLVFVHGIPTDYRIFNSQLQYFSPKYRTISISRRHAFPNKNEQLKVSDSTVANNSEDLVKLITQLKLAPIRLVGHSYGGFVSLFTAWKHPELLKSLVLIEPAIPSILVKNERNPLEVLGFLLSNPSAASSARKFQSEYLRMSLRSYEKWDYYDAVKYFYNGIKEDPNGFEKLPSSIRELMLSNGKTIGELANEFPVFTKDDARTIQVPTLLIKGDRSPTWLQAMVDNLSKKMPNSSCVQITNSGHLPHIENPSELNSRLSDFLDKSKDNS